MRVKIKRKIFILLLSFLVLLFFGFSVNALEITYPQVPGIDKTPKQCMELASEEQLSCYLQYIYHFVLSISGLICFFAIVSGGILYLIAGGSVEKIKDARERMFVGMLGTIILLSSYMILNLVNPGLLLFKISRQDPVMPPAPEIIPLEKIVPAYIEIPYGRLIERVKIIADIANYWSYQVWYEGSEYIDNNHVSLRELTQCLKQLSDECNCGDILTDCPPPPGKCIGDPCDKNRTTSCQDVSNLPANLRDSINNVNQRINEKRIGFSYAITAAENARMALDVTVARLELGEALIRDSRTPALNFDSFIALKDTEIRIIWGDEDTPINSEYASIPDEYLPPTNGNGDDNGTPILTGDWQLPILNPTVLSSDSVDHRDRCRICAWDFTAECGRPIYPAKDGIVTRANCDNAGGYGCWVVVEHAGGFRTYYVHIRSYDDIKVSYGDKVYAYDENGENGTVIGYVGCTGITSFGPHLHFEIRGPYSTKDALGRSCNGTIDPQTIFGNPADIGLPYEKWCALGRHHNDVCDARNGIPESASECKDPKQYNCWKKHWGP